MLETRTYSRTSYRQLAQRIRVPAGFVLLPLLLLASRPLVIFLAPGVLLAIVGLGVRAWASSYVKKNQELCTTGPYARTRNPLYFGTFLMGSGIAISTGSLWFVGVFLLLYAAIYVPVMKAEAETLAGLFPSEYGAYSATVPFFLPRLTRRPEAAVHASDAGADWSLYLRHREYRAALGVVLVYALMAAKALILQA